MEEVAKAYWAAVIDCDGSIVITKTNGYYFIRIMIYQKKPKIIYQAKNEFNCGSIRKYIQNTAVKNDAVMHYWHATTNDAEKVLRTILPYMRIKKEQAKLALEFQEHKRKNDVRGKRNKDGSYKKIDQKMIEKKEWFRKQISKLNKGKLGG